MDRFQGFLYRKQARTRDILVAKESHGHALFPPTELIKEVEFE